MIRNYNLIINTGNGMFGSYFVDVDFDLLDAYKRSVIQKEGFVIWDKGIIDVSKVVGVIDNTYYPVEENKKA